VRPVGSVHSPPLEVETSLDSKSPRWWLAHQAASVVLGGHRRTHGQGSAATKKAADSPARSCARRRRNVVTSFLGSLERGAARTVAVMLRQLRVVLLLVIACLMVTGLVFGLSFGTGLLEKLVIVAIEAGLVFAAVKVNRLGTRGTPTTDTSTI
jgi:hypothetical protein